MGEQPFRRAGLRAVLVVALLALGFAPPRSTAADRPLQAVATFSILADLVREVGGDRVAVTSLIGPDSDAHGFSPTPDDARRLAAADIVFMNGLGFEGWIERLVKASNTKAPVIVASRGVTAMEEPDEHEWHDHVGHDHADHIDPHAWQSVANAKLYVAAIRDGLSKADPDRAAVFAANAAAYTQKLDALEADIRTVIAAIPQARRQLITSHESFGYFGKAYGLRFLAPKGVSSDSEAGPADIARIIRQIRKDKIPAIFLENVADPRLMQQIARESGARIGGRIYSDALSGPQGPAPTYLAMMRANLQAFREALD